VTNTILTILAVAFLVWIVPPIVRWALLDAVWTGSGREDCLGPDAGACWPFVTAKFAQFMYGRYPIDERWRVDLTAVLLVIGLVPLAIPGVPFKRENIAYMLGVFPVVAMILLTGGHFAISLGFVAILIAAGCVGTAAIGASTERRASPVLAGVVAPVAGLLAVVIFVAALILKPADLVFDVVLPPIVLFEIGPVGVIDLARLVQISRVVAIDLAVALIALAAGLVVIFTRRGSPGRRSLFTLWAAIGALVLLCFALRTDFGLVPVETPLWGGLLVTLVVAIVGIVASLPIGILLALGRRSTMPVVRLLSVTLIEFVRGVPLITVLFMASVMLPVFLPPGVTFDKLLRALIGVAIFSSAYMAEVVRGGLQAIPRGQYEAARAIGLGYWPLMRLIILPQALRIVIPGIVNSFISLFKDTSLVLIIGIFDLLGIVQLGFSDQNWAGPNIPATGYAFAAAIFWVFCFGMSRYSIYTERRLHTGHRRR